MSWETEYQAWRTRSLTETDYVYVWVDGVHFRVRLEEDRLGTLVMIGVRPDGTKELIAVEDGDRESPDTWSTVLRDLKRRGLRGPVGVVGDSAVGVWAAVGAVWPQLREQRSWVPRLAAVGRDKPTDVERPTMTRRRRPRPLPRPHLVHSLRDDSAPESGWAASGDLSLEAAPALSPAARRSPVGLATHPFTRPGSTTVASTRLGVDFILLATRPEPPAASMSTLCVTRR